MMYIFLYRKRDSRKFLPGSVIKLFFMCLFFCQPFVLVYTRIREVQYFRLWPKFSSKGSNYSCNSRLMWISVPIREVLVYFYVTPDLYVVCSQKQHEHFCGKTPSLNEYALYIMYL